MAKKYMKSSRKEEKMDFNILIIGTDINAYTMARCAHELYGKKVDLIGKEEMKFTSLSSITNILYEPNLWDKETFKKTLKEYAEKQNGKKILLIATNDTYVRFIVENEKYLKKWYIFNYPTVEIMDNFLKKDKFYEAYKNQLPLPQTYIYTCPGGNLDKMNLSYPIIIKPGNGVLYYKYKFEGQSKVYKAKTKEELLSIIEKIENSGYDDMLILQEFIEGDDSKLFDCMFYVSKKGKAQLATFAQIGLQEHTHTGIGNCTVLMNGYSEYGIDTNIVQELKKFLEEIKYTGFAEFDLKYDQKDKKYKVLEINPRQARCSYYFARSTKNLVECLVEDLIGGKETKFTHSTKKTVLSFVPKTVMMKNIENEKLKKAIQKQIKANGYINPLKYKKDTSLKRKIYLFLRDINYIKKYRKKNWW